MYARYISGYYVLRDFTAMQAVTENVRNRREDGNCSVWQRTTKYWPPKTAKILQPYSG